MFETPLNADFPGRLCFMRPQLLEFLVWALKNTGIDINEIIKSSFE